MLVKSILFPLKIKITPTVVNTGNKEWMVKILIVVNIGRIFILDGGLMQILNNGIKWLKTIMQHHIQKGQITWTLLLIRTSPIRNQRFLTCSNLPNLVWEL